MSNANIILEVVQQLKVDQERHDELDMIEPSQVESQILFD